ncbi:phage major capsid protein [Clostridium perfringens]|uniref:phage major capsid protein n=1 Tax=Clostridium perfringens TaxID=1502 RepID=UPI0018976C18|nr:phage major capsid protein [Clostridium perfringens]
MLRKKIEKIINAKLNKRKALREKAEKAQTVEELRAINNEADVLDEEISELREMLDSDDDPEGGDGEEGNDDPQKRSIPSITTGGNGFNPLGTYSTRKKKSSEGDDLEYRKAFMKCVLAGEAIPEDIIPAEQRSAATTLTTDVGVLIPQTVLNKIVEKLKFYGNIFSRVTMTNIKGGVSIPKSSAKPVASWVSEGKVADKQKKTVNGHITFAYHKLQCRVAVSLEADTTTLSVFESTVIDNVTEAMIVALEEAILNGTGSGQPLGITKDTAITSEQKIAMSPDEIGSWQSWSKVFAKVPLKKRIGTVLIVNNETFEGDIAGMVDANGQPIARVNYGLDGKETYRFKGKEVIPVEDYLPTFTDVAADSTAVWGVLVNLKDYMLNSNLQMAIKRYFDEDTDEKITKATTLADGKLADTQGVILLTKKNAGRKATRNRVQEVETKENVVEEEAKNE